MGVRPCKLGRPKFTRPSPPKVVPRREKRAWFWLMGSNCPLHRAQPLGANSNEKIRISLRNGSAILHLLFLLAQNVVEYGFMFETVFCFCYGHKKNLHLTEL